MEKNKLEVKDLINAGLFSILITAFYWCGGMIGYMPVLMPIVPFVGALVSAPVFMLYSTKINKFGMVLILGIVEGCIFTVSGHGIYVLPGIILISFITEYILKSGNYKSIKKARLGYTVFSIFAGFNLIPLYFARDAYVQKLIEMDYPQTFIDQMLNVLPGWSFLPITLLGCVGGFIGATFGIHLLNKHFKKANMV